MKRGRYAASIPLWSVSISATSSAGLSQLMGNRVTLGLSARMLWNKQCDQQRKNRKGQTRGSHSLSLNLVDNGFLGRVLAELLLGVVVVDVVPNPHKLLVEVRAGEQHHRHPNQVIGRDFCCRGRVHLYKRRES